MSRGFRVVKNSSNLSVDFQIHSYIYFILLITKLEISKLACFVSIELVR